MKPLVLFVLIGCFVSAAAQDSAPRFTDYPARVSRTGTPVRVKQNSTPDTPCFRTMLRRARQGQRFAGHYAIDYWGCGTNCARIGIVDLLTGRAYVSPFYVGIAGGGEQDRSLKTKPDSKLVLLNDPEVVREEYGDPPPEAFAPAYFLWTGKHLLPIRHGKADQSEPKRAFERCADTNRN